MRFPSWLTTYLHSLIGITVALVILWVTLNFLHTRGPAIVAGPAGAIGSYATGQAFNFRQ